MAFAAIDATTSHLRPWMPWATIPPASLDSRIAWLRTCRGEFALGKDFVLGIFDRSENEVGSDRPLEHRYRDADLPRGAGDRPGRSTTYSPFHVDPQNLDGVP